MGTRHLIAVVIDEHYKIAQYGQFDGYPGGQGTTILEFLRTVNHDAFKKKLNNVFLYSDESWDELTKRVETNQFLQTSFNTLYPELNRDLSAKILTMVQLNKDKELYLKDSLDFVGDSLFCEWAYVIDFDDNVLEVYKGFNEEPLDESERFYGFKQEREKYYPVKFKAKWSLDNLPTNEEFINTLDPREVEEDE